MKKILTIALLAAVVAGCAPKENVMRLSGRYDGAPDGTVLCLIAGTDTVANATVKHGKFRFDLEGIEPYEFVLCSRNDSLNACVLFYGDYCDTRIELHDQVTNTFGTVFRECTVEGNPVDSVVRSVNNYIFGSQVDPKTLSDMVVAAVERNDMSSAYVMWKYGNLLSDVYDYYRLKAFCDNLPEGVKTTKIGKSVVERVEEMMTVAINATAPDFTQNDPDGNPVTLSEFVKGKRVVMIDFWASWCGQCRAEGKNVVEFYKQFRDKGFDILGYSLDDDADEWKKAIAEDGFGWSHVSELKGWKSEICDIYQFHGIPHFVLVDGNMKILENRDLRGEEMQKRILELLGE